MKQQNILARHFLSQLCTNDHISFLDHNSCSKSPSTAKTNKFYIHPSPMHITPTQQLLCTFSSPIYNDYIVSTLSYTDLKMPCNCVPDHVHHRIFLNSTQTLCTRAYNYFSPLADEKKIEQCVTTSSPHSLNLTTLSSITLTTPSEEAEPSNGFTPLTPLINTNPEIFQQ